MRRITLGQHVSEEVKQKHIQGEVNKCRRDAMVARAGMWDKARLEATSAAKAGSWLHAPPSWDMRLSNAEVQYGVGRRLGYVLCEERPCHSVQALWIGSGLIASRVRQVGIKR